MTETKQRCGATKGKETCNRELGHVGMHTNGGNVTWKGPKPEKVADTESSLMLANRRRHAEARAEAADRAKPPKAKAARHCDDRENGPDTAGRACALPPGHEGEHGDGVKTWSHAASVEPASLADLCPKCGRELGEHDGKKCPKGAKPLPADRLDHVFSLIEGATGGVQADQLATIHRGALVELERAGRIVYRNERWYPLSIDERRKIAQRDAVFFGADALRKEGIEVPPAPSRKRHVEPEIKTHPAADALPMIEGAEFDALVEDIRANGLRHKPVLDHAGEWLVDGRNRKRACEQLGIAIEYEHLPEGTNVAAYVISTNLKRRHLNESQRGMIAAAIANLGQGKRKTRPEGGFEGVTQAEAAVGAGVSERTVQRANAVRDKGVPELVDAVVKGKVDLKGAEQVAKLSPKQQRDLIKERVDSSKGPVRGGKLAAVARQEKKRETVRNINSGKVRPMPAGQFGVIYVDYPWKYENSDQHEGARGHAGYPQMTMEAIYAHAVEAAKRAAKDCVLALWVTNPYIGKIERVIEAYGAVQNTMLTWPKPKMGMGPKFSRSQTEHLVIATFGDPVHTLNEISTLLPAYAVREHSRKPDEVAELLQKHCAGPFLELFSQEERPNWTTWGAEAGKYATEAA